MGSSRRSSGKGSAASSPSKKSFYTTASLEKRNASGRFDDNERLVDPYGYGTEMPELAKGGIRVHTTLTTETARDSGRW